MLDMDEINREIANLENGKTTYSNCEKLTVLYSVRDHARINRTPTQEYSFASTRDSDFIRAANAVTPEQLIDVLDEHMESVRVLYPKEYAAVIRRLTSYKL